MKKILAGILSLCLTLNLAACSSAPASSGATNANVTYPDGMVSAGSLFKGAIWLDKQASAEVKEKLIAQTHLQLSSLLMIALIRAQQSVV